jgi:hypothetical protein
MRSCALSCFMCRWLTLGLPIVAVLLAMFAVLSFRDRLHIAVPILLAMFACACVAAAILGQVWLRLADRRVSDIRYLLGRHQHGSSDPATWTGPLLGTLQGARKMFGTNTYAEAVPSLLKQGACARAMWAERLATAVEGRRDGEVLTRAVLADREIQKTIGRIRRDPERWAELTGAAAARDQAPDPAPTTAIRAAASADVRQEVVTAVLAGPSDSAPSDWTTVTDERRPSSSKTLRHGPSTGVILAVVLGGGLLFAVVVVALVVGIAAMRWNRLDVAGAGGGDDRPPQQGQADLVAKAPAQPAPPAGVAGKTTVDLIPLMKPNKDTVHGRWTIARNVLHCPEGGFVPRLEIPYAPPDEYDFIVTFSQPGLGNGISLIMPNPRGGSFFWYFGRDECRTYGFHTEPDKDRQLKTPIKTNTPYTAAVQVRRGGVTGLLNGKALITYKTDFANLVCDDWRKIRDTKHLAVACDDPTVFHYVRVVEITGSGRKTR